MFIKEHFAEKKSCLSSDSVLMYGGMNNSSLGSRWCSGYLPRLAPMGPGFNSHYGLYVQMVIPIHAVLKKLMLQSKC